MFLIVMRLGMKAVTPSNALNRKLMAPIQNTIRPNYELDIQI